MLVPCAHGPCVSFPTTQLYAVIFQKNFCPLYSALYITYTTSCVLFSPTVTSTVARFLATLSSCPPIDSAQVYSFKPVVPFPQIGTLRWVSHFSTAIRLWHIQDRLCYQKCHRRVPSVDCIVVKTESSQLTRTRFPHSRTVTNKQVRCWVH